MQSVCSVPVVAIPGRRLTIQDVMPFQRKQRRGSRGHTRVTRCEGQCECCVCAVCACVGCNKGEYPYTRAWSQGFLCVCVCACMRVLVRACVRVLAPWCLTCTGITNPHGKSPGPQPPPRGAAHSWFRLVVQILAGNGAWAPERRWDGSTRPSCAERKTGASTMSPPAPPAPPPL